jgi:hypothetical protein
MSKSTKQIAEFKPDARFLSLNVYKFPLGNCGGTTDHLGKESIWIPCEDGFMTFDKIEDKTKIFIPEQRSGEYWALNPLIQPANLLGPMCGGNLAYSSDSRCRRVYHIHDRFETQTAYDANW